MKQYGIVTHVGLDHHKMFGTVTARDRDNNVVFREQWKYRDRTQLREQLRRYPAGTPVILESSFAWGWMADELKAAKLDAHLASARKMAGWREARGLAKSNRIDADLLSEVWLERKRWWEVWLASQEVRDERELLRYRMGLVVMQTMVKCRIHSTLLRHGILREDSDLFGKRGLKFLEGLTDERGPLREVGRTVLGGQLLLLSQLRRQIVEVTLILRKSVARNAQAELWRSLPGVGWVLAYTIQAEVGDASRFKSGRRLASYALLAPKSDDSGEEDGSTPMGRHVGHAGRWTLQWAFIEAAHGAVRKDALFREKFNRQTESGTRNCNRGYIGVGRKMAEVGLACVKKGIAYCPTWPERPGSQEAQADNGKEN